MMSVGLHLRMIGRPGRIGALDRTLTEMRPRGFAWIARREDSVRESAAWRRSSSAAPDRDGGFIRWRRSLSPPPDRQSQHQRDRRALAPRGSASLRSGRFEVAAVCAQSGLRAIQTPDEASIAADAVVAAIAGDREASAVVVGAFGDPGLRKARAIERRPIVGLGESGLLAAGQNGRRFAIVTLGAAMRDALTRRVCRFGLAGACPSRSPRFSPVATLTGAIGDEVRACARASGTEAVLLGGAPFAGLAARLASKVATLTLDGVEACIDRIAEMSTRPETGGVNQIGLLVTFRLCLVLAK